MIISAEDMTRGKPDPEGYRRALQSLQIQANDSLARIRQSSDRTLSGLQAANCLVIEDSLAGVVSAKDAGMRVIGIPNTYTSNQLQESGVDDIIDGLAMLTPAWIEKRFAS